MQPKLLTAHNTQDLARIHAASFDYGWPEADFISHIENPTDDVIGLLNEDGVLGFVISRTAIDQSEILTIAVDVKARAKGYGMALLRAAEMAALARGVDIMFLEVAEDNDAACALYKNAAYITIAKRPGYYRRLQDGKQTRVGAHIMQKRL